MAARLTSWTSRFLSMRKSLCLEHIMNLVQTQVPIEAGPTMEELSGILPEDIPVEEGVKRIAAAERKQQR